MSALQCRPERSDEDEMGRVPSCHHRMRMTRTQWRRKRHTILLGMRFMPSQLVICDLRFVEAEGTDG